MGQTDRQTVELTTDLLSDKKVKIGNDQETDN